MNSYKREITQKEESLLINPRRISIQIKRNGILALNFRIQSSKLSKNNFKPKKSSSRKKNYVLEFLGQIQDDK